MEPAVIKDLESCLGYTFSDKNLLITAVTHKTYAFEAAEPLEYNERLEFLGDSVLNFVITELLYKGNKYFSEGELTRRRAMIVNNKVLALKAKELNLGKYLLLGKGEVKQQGASNQTNLANTFEGIIGAMYLDAGLKKTTSFILKHIVDDTII